MFMFLISSTVAAVFCSNNRELKMKKQNTLFMIILLLKSS